MCCHPPLQYWGSGEEAQQGMGGGLGRQRQTQEPANSKEQIPFSAWCKNYPCSKGQEFS